MAKSKRRRKTPPKPRPNPKNGQKSTQAVAKVAQTVQTAPVAYNWNLTPEKIETLVTANIIPNGTPEAQIHVFRQICAARELDPFSREIYLVKYGNKYEPIVGIMGYRNLAFKTGEHMGTSDAVYNKKGDGTGMTAFEISESGKPPKSATVTVNKLIHGNIVEFTHTCLLQEFAKFYNGQLADKWKTMTCQMLAKCAEAFALRKAWPSIYAGTMIPEEQGAYENDKITKRVKLNDKINKPAEGIEDAVVIDYEPVFKAIKDIDPHDGSAMELLAKTYKKEYLDNADLVRSFAAKKREIITHIGETLEGITRKSDVEEYWKANEYWHTVKEIKSAFEAKLNSYN